MPKAVKWRQKLKSINYDFKLKFPERERSNVQQPE